MITVADKSVIHSQSIQKLSRFLLLVFNKHALIHFGSFCFVRYFEAAYKFRFSVIYINVLGLLMPKNARSDSFRPLSILRP